MCVPMQDRALSRIWLVLNDEDRLKQVMQQMKKLPDVIELKNHDEGHPAFSMFQQWK